MSIDPAALTAALLSATFGLYLAGKVCPLVRLSLVRKPQGAHS